MRTLASADEPPPARLLHRTISGIEASDRSERASLRTVLVVDDLDTAIVGALQEDARRTNKEIADRVGIAPSTCHQRIQALVRRGVITGFRAEVDLASLNRGVQALISVQVRPLHRSVIDAFQDFTSTLPEILSSFVLAGQDDFVLHVAVQDLDHLHAFLIDRLSKRKEVAGFRTSVVYRHTRSTSVTALAPG